MAFRSMNYLRTLGSRVQGNRALATSTTPKMKPFAPALDDNLHHTKPRAVKGEKVPVYVALGTIMLAFTFVGLTAKQHLVYSPAVHVSKKKRETLTELYDPDNAVDESEKFVKRSFFRKVAHSRDFDPTVPNPIHADVYSIPAHAETLKSVGVNPRSQI